MRRPGPRLSPSLEWSDGPAERRRLGSEKRNDDDEDGKTGMKINAAVNRRFIKAPQKNGGASQAHKVASRWRVEIFRMLDVGERGDVSHAHPQTSRRFSRMHDGWPWLPAPSSMTGRADRHSGCLLQSTSARAYGPLICSDLQRSFDIAGHALHGVRIQQ
jgi:hypothetical protein